MANNKIEIRNVYYMLSYAFKVLKPEDCTKVAGEEFSGIYDLFAEILNHGISQQLKLGLHRQYVIKEESLLTVRGKIQLSQTLKNKLRCNRKLHCEYDELSENNLFNQILKTTILALLKCNDEDIKKERKKSLKKLLFFFDSVNSIELGQVKWKSLQFDRNNKNYQMLLYLCYFIYKGLLLNEENGIFNMLSFSDGQQMHKLYEKFLLEYYRKHYPELTPNPTHIAWQLDDNYKEQLPCMQTDIYLKHNDKVLIIDAKYYSKTFQSRYENSYKLISANLYQIFTYVKNEEYRFTKLNKEHSIAGMLLYAKTDSDISPNNTYNMSGNIISAKTLDLTVDIPGIQTQLNNIVEDYFGIIK